MKRALSLLVLAVALAVALPIAAWSSSATLELSPNPVGPNQSYEISGCGYPEYGRVYITVDGKARSYLLFDDTTADGDGCIALLEESPPYLGTFKVTTYDGTQRKPQRLASATLTVSEV